MELTGACAHLALIIYVKSILRIGVSTHTAQSIIRVSLGPQEAAPPTSPQENSSVLLYVVPGVHLEKAS